jgi:multidrug efflux pump subunit AcrA (membrane-fusion protein)
MVKKSLDYFRVPKWALWSVLGLLVIAGLTYALRPKVLAVDSGRIERQVFEELVIDEGVSVYKNKRVIAAPADGVMPSHDIKPGFRVKQGQELFVFLWDRNISVTSPLTGVVLQVFERDRRSMLRGTPLLEIGDPQDMEIRAALLTEEVIGLVVGQKAYVAKWGGAEDLEARIQRIAPSAREVISALGVKEQRVDVFFEITSPKKLWSQLGDNFRLEVRIVRNKIEDALTVPIGAIFRKNETVNLYTIDNQDIVHLATVKIGARNRDFAELKSDLPPGTRVVLYPGSQIKEGSLVKVRREL